LWIAAGKSDIYLSHRGAAGDFKTSLHESGSSHTGFSAEFVRRLVARGGVPPKRRHIDAWSSALEGVVFDVPMRVLVAGSELRTYAAVHRPDPEVEWIPAPGSNEVVQIGVVRVMGSVKVGGWPGARAMGTRLLYECSLPNGISAFLVWHKEEVNPWLKSELARVHRVLGDAGMREGGGAATSRLVGVAYGRSSEDDSRFAIEVNLGNSPQNGD
jgi:hypothetical protein